MADEKHGTKATFDLAGDSFDVLTLHIEERLDELPLLEARLTKDPLPKPATLLNGEVDARIGDLEDFGAARSFKGIVVAAERRIDTAGRPFVRVEVRPKLWRLTKRTDCRTFQQKKVDEIVKQVCEAAGVKDLRFSLTGSYEPREYVVQYRETDWDFIRRLLSEEGIAFTVDHASGEVVFFDDPLGLGDATPSSLAYRPEFGFDQGRDKVWKISESARVVSDKVMLRDYDFERPRFNVEATVEGKDDGEHALEVYAFPARSTNDAVVKQWSQVMLDSIQSRRDLYEGAATAWALTPGFRFKIEEHPYEEINTELLTTAVTLHHEDERSPFRPAGASRTSLRFEAMPTDRSSYRPARLARGRELAGAQTGVTTGPSGQEIHVDEHGRVNVQFPWDRVGKKDEKSSIPMRTIQLPTGGSMMLPRVGWEVVVQHDEGDVDLPLCMGRLYNTEKPPPYALPGGAARSSIQTATTPGGGSTNELRTDDTKGKEEMFFNASKDMTVMVNHNETETVGNNATLKVGGNQTIDITNSVTTSIGSNQTLDVGGNQKTSIETFKVDQIGGDHSYDIGGNRDMKVGGDHKHTIGGSEGVDVGSLKTDLVVGKISEAAAGNISLDVGAARVSLTAGDYNTTIGGNHNETISAAKIVASFAGVSSDVSGTQTTQIVGAKLHKVDADRCEKAGAMLTSIAAGASIVKADNITFEADGMLTLVMGASMLVVTPAAIAFLGVSMKIDGATAETAALIIDN
ncbi:MAG: type VI secretion system tip protein VgrG [Polyangiaceae bacterium]|jgi:type VI secretion system secreted protein VgrG|nr:type VI secretion system tip protein VgrG [Polyangiaceae bacterium]